VTNHFYKCDLPDKLDLGDTVAIDCETMGLNIKRDRLCLVQLSSGDGDAHIVQIMQNQNYPKNLCALLQNKRKLKIFHYGRFDIAILYHAFNVTTEHVYCTKIASKLARTYTDRHGLKNLLQELLDVDLSKQQQSSDWGAEKLTEAQLDYAASDVLYLHSVMEKLNTILERESRIELAKACFAFLPARAKLDVIGWSEIDIFSH